MLFMRSYDFAFHRTTPMGEGGIALVELYGRDAEEVVAAVFRPRGGSLPAPQETRLGELFDAGERLDEGLATRLSGDSAWSRLETWSLEVHGGLWFQERLLRRLEALGGTSLDTRGVLRLAVDAGALDAIQSCAYELLIQSTTLRAARFFLRQHHGELSTELRRVLALVDGGQGLEAGESLERLLRFSGPACCLGRPLRVLIAGRSNAGKSTLFNALVEDEHAVVSPRAGTTRDRLEELITIRDYPILLADSAGLRPLEQAGAVEKEGIRRSWASLESDACDRVLYLIEPPWKPTSEDREFLRAAGRGRCLVVATKTDPANDGCLAPDRAQDGEWAIDSRVSAQEREGLGDLRELVVERWLGPHGDDSATNPCAPFTACQATCLRRARDALRERNLDDVREALIECLKSWN